MAQRRGIAQDYVSPHTRWALLLDDHPMATKEYGFASAGELGIPEGWSVIEFLDREGEVTNRVPVVEYVTCTLHVPGREDVVGWKEIPDDIPRSPEELVKRQTMALGRATRSAGYPDRLGDLRSMVLWRQRKLEALAAGGHASMESVPDPNSASTAWPATRSLPAGDPDDDYVDPDAVLETSADPDTSETVRPAPGTLQTLRELITELGSKEMKGAQSALRAWCRDQGMQMGEPATELEAQQQISKGWELREERLDPDGGYA